jgi:nucleoside-triphosphatase
MTGFFTSEIREKGQRLGFSIETLNGEKGILAHIDNNGPIKVGRYGVNIKDINSIAVPSMLPSRPDEIVVIDEIGKMECLSQLFKKTLLDVLDSDHPIIGSIAIKGDPFIRKIRERNDVELIQVSEKNRDTLTDLSLLY